MNRSNTKYKLELRFSENVKFFFVSEEGEANNVAGFSSEGGGFSSEGGGFSFVGEASAPN
uniref:Uncharacterized protein n=1 Tax=Ipomoea trifida TaxID=35884 RepID=A0A947_IPOTF|nr:hypothetical protein [Ipomoea trifida]